jgi:hypothetical protein
VDNTQHSHTHYSPDEIRTRNPSNLTAVDPLLGLRGLFDYVRLFISSFEEAFSAALNENIVLSAEFMGRNFALKMETVFFSETLEYLVPGCTASYAR